MTIDESIQRIIDTLGTYIQRNNYLSAVGSKYRIYHDECRDIRREIEKIVEFAREFMDVKINLEWHDPDKPRGIAKVYLTGMTEIKRKGEEE